MGGDAFSLIGAIVNCDLHCKPAFNCNCDLDKYGGIVLWFLLMLYMFKCLGTICDEYFVPSLEVIVEKLQLSNDVAGATFMAAGSSAPELFTSLVSTFLIVNEGGVGTIVGSAIFNILVMNGVTAWVACKETELKIWWYPLARDTSFYSLSILELVLVLWDDEVEWYEGLVMVLSYCGYCLYMKLNPSIIKYFGIVSPESEVKAPATEDKTWWEPVQQVGTANGGAKVVGPPGHPTSTVPQPPPGEQQTLGRPSVDQNGKHAHWSYRHSMQSCGGTGGTGGCGSQQLTSAAQPGPGSTCQENEAGAANKSGGNGAADANGTAMDECTEPTAVEPSRPCCRDPANVLWELSLPEPERFHGFGLFSMSILWIGVCTYLMVDSTNRIGVIMNVPPFVMGLIFLAAGTSIPDTLGSIAVARQGEGDMAIANALGSNVFDILIGLGVPWTIRAFTKPVKFDNKDDLLVDVVILTAVLFVFVVTLRLNGWRLSRRIGMVLISFYAVYVIYNLMAVFVFEIKKVKDTDED
mmetsp:Transcript_37570/g.66702  ORF Transcript_37570/g.66702 Transcript_37570/m.66702 type:complete len:523 (+) Transcript_37570:237-1805(+)